MIRFSEWLVFDFDIFDRPSIKHGFRDIDSSIFIEQTGVMEFIYDQLRIYDYIVIIMLYKVLMNDKQTHKLFILTEAAHL